VRAFEAQAYELILMDCHMPALDELAATRDIRGLGERGCQVPIIALTADLFAFGRDHCRAAGMNNCFTKPIETEPVHEVSSRLTRAVRGG